MIVGGINKDKNSEALVAASGKTHPKEFWGKGGARGDGMANNGFHSEMEGGVLGDRACQGGLEGMHGGGEMLTQSECGAIINT